MFAAKHFGHCIGNKVILMMCHRLFQKYTFLSVMGPTQLYFLSVHWIICLSCIFKVNNKPKYSAGARTDNRDFLPVLHKICPSGPVGHMILEKSGLVHFSVAFNIYIPKSLIRKLWAHLAQWYALYFGHFPCDSVKAKVGFHIGHWALSLVLERFWGNWGSEKWIL